MSETNSTKPYYFDATFDPQKSTIADLKTILVKHGVALPTGRVLKEDYVLLFRTLAKQAESARPDAFVPGQAPSTNPNAFVKMTRTRSKEAALVLLASSKLQQSEQNTRLESVASIKTKQSALEIIAGLASRRDRDQVDDGTASAEISEKTEDEFLQPSNKVDESDSLIESVMADEIADAVGVATANLASKDHTSPISHTEMNRAFVSSTIALAAEPVQSNTHIESEPGIIIEDKQPVNILVKQFTEMADPPSEAQASKIEYMTTVITNVVNDRKKKIMEFGKGIKNTFGFARRTIFDPFPAATQRPEKLKRSGPPPLPPPPTNPQKRLRPLKEHPHRPDFVVPATQPPCISQTGLSPPASLLDRKKKPNSSNTPSPSSRRSPGKGSKTSPLGLRSSGPRRVAASEKQTPLRESATIVPPFTPRQVPDVPVLFDMTKVCVSNDGDQSVLNKSLVVDGDVERTVAFDGASLVVDAEFKRKYGLQDVDNDSEDEPESVKRPKSMQLNGAWDDSADEISSSPGRYNLRHRGGKVEGSGMLLTDKFKNSVSMISRESGVANGVKQDDSTTELLGEESEEVILKPDAVRRVAYTFGGLFAGALVLPFMFALVSWWIEVGGVIQYCPSATTTFACWIPPTAGSLHGHAKDFWGQYLPGCVICPKGAVCEGPRVVGCAKEGWEVFGDEGFGPLGGYLGFSPVCLQAEEMQGFVVKGGDNHFNPRIFGNPLPLWKRVELWLAYWKSINEVLMSQMKESFEFIGNLVKTQYVSFWKQLELLSTHIQTADIDKVYWRLFCEKLSKIYEHVGHVGRRLVGKNSD